MNSFAKFPFDEYNSPDAYIELTHDEEVIMTLANVVSSIFR